MIRSFDPIPSCVTMTNLLDSRVSSCYKQSNSCSSDRVEGIVVSDLQRQVQDAIDALVESGAERGVQVAVYRRGEQVVDAVAGAADPATGRPVTPATVFYPYSVGKAMTATVAHLLAERGLFGYDTPIAELWPEFGAHGKQAATVRHALTHTVGVPGIPAD